MEVNRIKDKIVIKFEAELLTGMHIGAGEDISTIGAVDSEVVRDPITHKTMIPGSSLKGKLRALLSRAMVNEEVEQTIIDRLFGNDKAQKCARLQFVDSVLAEKSAEELNRKNLELSYTEIKYENTIDRITLKGKHPRQIERAVKGSRFNVEFVYTLENEEELEKDLSTLKKGINLLELDYIGGSGTRGYGRIKFVFSSFEPQNINGQIVDKEKYKKIFMEKNSNEV
ncbi:MAG: type III-A CRISPR-associated RAMP protein Csm3 [Lachnospiraceae bacterium]|jgi:CRISPR-associated protein Csm3|nr:type III-A CRISPR-associated RAMP protein Csm3 [Lachnospiraceae bacterium]